MYPDFLTCGLCAIEFPLSGITDFIAHKTSCMQTSGSHSLGIDEAGSVPCEPALSCFFCGTDFYTARGILQHIQSSHQMNIVQQKTYPVADPSQQLITTFGAPLNLCSTANNRSGLPVVTAATISDAPSSTASLHICDGVSISFSKAAILPMVCAKLALTEGMTMCCEGNKCKTTIKPLQQNLPYKKRCSTAVVSEKRSCFIQENDTEDKEQCALETLTNLRDLLLNQKCKQGEKKAKKSKWSCSRKSRSAMSCEKEPTRYRRASEESEEGREPERCGSYDQMEEDSDTDCCGPSSGTRSDKSRKSKVDSYSIEKESIASKKTVIMNSGMSVPVQPTQNVVSSEAVDSQGSSAPSTPISSEDTSQESAQLLAELMYSHRSLNLDQSVVMPLPSMQTTAGSSVPLTSLADDALQSCFSSSDLDSSLVSANALSRCPMFANTNTPLDLPANIVCPVGPLLQAAGVSELDMKHLPDLDTLTASMQEQDSQQGTSISTALATISSIDGMHFNSLGSGQGVTNSLGSSQGTDPVHLGSDQGTAAIGLGSCQGTVPVRLLSTLGTVPVSLGSGQDIVPVILESTLGNVSVSLGSGQDTVPVKLGSTLDTVPVGQESGQDFMCVGEMVKGVKKRRYPTSRPYQCTECDKAFNQPIHLKKHTSKHTGVKPFKCQNCEYSTVERSHLRAHNRIHTGEKPFQCQFCSYATAQNSTLKVHLRRHHQNKQTTAATTTITKQP